MPKADVEGDEEMIWGWEKELESGRGGELFLCGIGTAAVRDVGAPGSDDCCDCDVIASSCLLEGEKVKVSATLGTTRRSIGVSKECRSKRTFA